MAPRERNENEVPLGRFKSHPSEEKMSVKTPHGWIISKRIDDDIGPYWRIHNKLYDLTDFIKRHPGGKFWIETTKGTDITEAFESSHIKNTAEKMLLKYFVKDIHTPRNSPYTFHEDGFYKTLKRKALPILQKSGTNATRQMLLIQDGLALSFAILALIGSYNYSYPIVVISGFIMAMTAMCAHNFIHQKDSFRVYYFDLILLSSYEYRISHELSHHQFTNTRYDFEVTSFEPLLVFSPKPEKTYFQRYGSQVYEIFLVTVLFYIDLLKRIYLLVTRQTTLRPENLIPFAEMLVMCTLAPSVGAGIRLWLVLHLAANGWLLGIGVAVGHHHPEIYHEGDRFRDMPDWGLCQLDAVRDRYEIKGNLFVGATNFGDHSLHHLFPTVDYSRLDQLYPVFFETCKEFNIPHEFLSQWELAKGMYKQLANNTPNTSPPGYKVKKVKSN